MIIERGKTHVMVDLETLGQSAGSVIVSIGAVKIVNGEIVDDHFYELIDAGSCVEAGLTMDAETVIWWMKQCDAARAEIYNPARRELHEVLHRLSCWIDNDDARLWGNGASFDNVLLAAAYDAMSMRRPWKFWNDRCFRTVKAMFPEVRTERAGVHHNALDDALFQAEHLLAIDAAGND